jgi:hypothetical protein
VGINRKNRHRLALYQASEESKKNGETLTFRKRTRELDALPVKPNAFDVPEYEDGHGNPGFTIPKKGE